MLKGELKAGCRFPERKLAWRIGLAVVLRQIQALPTPPPSARLPKLATHRTCLLFTFTKAALTSSQRLSRSYWFQNQGMTKLEMEEEG